MSAYEHPAATSLGRLVRERWDVLAVIALGGMLGSLARWGVAEALPHSGDDLPWATVLVNVLGAFLLGAVTVLLDTRWPGHRHLRPLIGVGVLGGFTTYSTAVLDARGAYAADAPSVALGGLLVTLALALPAAWLGLVAARTLVRSRL